MQAFGAQLNEAGSSLDVLPGNINHQLILRVCFGVHFLLTSLAFLSDWCPNVYAFYNAFLIAGFWIAATTTHVDLAIFKLAAMEAVTVVLDIFVIAIYYNQSSKEGVAFYCFIAFILQLLGRFGALLGLHRIRKERKNAGLANETPFVSRPDYQPVQSSATAVAPADVSSAYNQYSAAPKTLGELPDLSQKFAQQRYQ